MGTGTSYTVEISNDGFSSTSWNVTNATGSSTNFTGLGEGTYSWRIKANDTCNDGWHTQAGSFKVELSPVTPTGLNDITTVTAGDTISLDWTAESFGTYDVEFDTNGNTAGGWQTIYTDVSPTQNYTIPCSWSGTNYKWRVVHKTTNCGTATSAEDVFNVNVVTPAGAVSAGDTDLCETTTSFVTWTTTAGYSYDVYYSANNTADTNGTSVATGISTSTVTNVAFATAGTYYWKVRAQNGSCYGVVEVSGAFTVHTPYTATPDAVPAGGCESYDAIVSWSGNSRFK